MLAWLSASDRDEDDGRFASYAGDNCTLFVVGGGLSSELFPDLSSFEATRGMGGSCGGKGETGEPEV